jgi:hypothetical protein
MTKLDPRVTPARRSEPRRANLAFRGLAGEPRTTRIAAGAKSVSPLNLAVVRHDVHDILQRDGAKMSLKRDREKAAVNSAIRAQLAC